LHGFVGSLYILFRTFAYHLGMASARGFMIGVRPKHACSIRHAGAPKIGEGLKKSRAFSQNSLPASEEEIFMIRRPDKQRTSVLHVIDEVSPWDGQMSPNRLSNLTIVVAEDHDDSRRFVGLFLDRLGATVVLARNGFEGLEATKNSRPECGGV
jgi:hypothetical protein